MNRCSSCLRIVGSILSTLLITLSALFLSGCGDCTIDKLLQGEPCTIDFNGGSDSGEGDDHDIEPGDDL